MNAVAEVTGVPQVTPSPPPIDPSGVQVPFVAFLIFALLVLAVWLLLRSFTTRLKNIRVPEEGEEVVVVRERKRRRNVPPSAPKV